MAVGMLHNSDFVWFGIRKGRLKREMVGRMNLVRDSGNVSKVSHRGETEVSQGHQFFAKKDVIHRGLETGVVRGDFPVTSSVQMRIDAH